MDLFEQISNDIKEAMKAKDKVKLETLRNVKKCFLEAKTAPGANDTLTDDAALKIMQKLVKQGKDSASVYEGQGRADLAEEEMAQVRVIEAYLPKQLSPEELEAKLKEIIARVGATSGKDMGKVMGVASKELAGLAEGRAISAKVKKRDSLFSNERRVPFFLFYHYRTSSKKFLQHIKRFQFREFRKMQTIIFHHHSQTTLSLHTVHTEKKHRFIIHTCQLTDVRRLFRRQTDAVQRLVLYETRIQHIKPATLPIIFQIRIKTQEPGQPDQKHQVEISIITPAGIQPANRRHQISKQRFVLPFLA